MRGIVAAAEGALKRLGGTMLSVRIYSNANEETRIVPSTSSFL